MGIYNVIFHIILIVRIIGLAVALDLAMNYRHKRYILLAVGWSIYIISVFLLIHSDMKGLYFQYFTVLSVISELIFAVTILSYFYKLSYKLLYIPAVIILGTGLLTWISPDAISVYSSIIEIILIIVIIYFALRKRTEIISRAGKSLRWIIWMAGIGFINIIFMYTLRDLYMPIAYVMNMVLSIIIIIFFLDINNNITQKSLSQNRKRIQYILDNMPGAFFRRKFDRQYTMITLSKGIKNLSGYSSDSFINNDDMSFLDIIADEDKERVWQTIADAVDLSEDYEVDYRIITQNNAICWVWEKGRTVFDKDIIYLEGFLIDINYRKQMETHIGQIEKLSAIGELAGGIAHDFNNQLTSILTVADILLYDMDKSHPMYDDIKRIHTAAENSADLTSRLLTFARKGKYKVSDCRINDIMKSVINIVEPTLKESIKLKIHSNSSRDLVKGDAGQLRNSFMNIIINSVDALRGKGKITINIDNPQYEEIEQVKQIIEPKNYIKITIADNGIGMDEKTLGRIFQPFFTTKEKGTGMGLAAVYGTIKNHNGYIFVESEKDRGAVFKIYLPVIEDKAEDEKSEDANIDTKKHLKVVIIDDNTAVMDILERVLSRFDSRISKFTQKKTAVEFIKENETDLVIIDLLMPDGPPDETIESIHKVQPDIKIVLMSGYYEKERIEQLMNGYVDSFMQKPLKVDRILSLIKELFQ